MVRRSFTTIKKALPNMFLYLKDDKIPRTTNYLESFFGNFKRKFECSKRIKFNQSQKLFEMVFILQKPKQ